MFSQNRILSIFLRNHRHCWNFRQYYAAIAEAQAEAKAKAQALTLPNIKTSEDDPINHSKSHLGKFYIIPPKVKEKLFLIGGIPRTWNMQMDDIFKEAAIMVRDPAIEIMSIIKKIDFSNPAVRFILYGVKGTGKTTALIHLVHYAHVSKFLLVHLPWASNWTKHAKEIEDSQVREGRIDLPVESALWLQHFKLQNSSILEELKLTTSKSYTWSKREVTEEGAPLTDVIEHGITRVRHSSDCVAVLLKEIKHQSQFGRFKTMVIVDGINAFYASANAFYAKNMPNRSVVLASDITVVHAMKKLLNNDWNNAVIITTVDTFPSNRDASMQDNFTPRYLLGKEGFELLDPFIPIQTHIYTEKEADTQLDYYYDRQWIQDEKARSEEGRKQLKFLSGNNPYQLRKLCDPL